MKMWSEKIRLEKNAKLTQNIFECQIHLTLQIFRVGIKIE